MAEIVRDAENVHRLRAVYLERYEAWVAAKERHDDALKAYHHAFSVLVEAEVAAARIDGAEDG